MSWSGNFGGHTDSQLAEHEILNILRDAADRISEVVGDSGFSASYYSTHHGSGGLRPPVTTQDEPVTPPPGPGLGAGGSTGGGGGG